MESCALRAALHGMQAGGICLNFIGNPTFNIRPGQEFLVAVTEEVDSDMEMELWEMDLVCFYFLTLHQPKRNFWSREDQKCSYLCQDCL